MIKRMGMGLVTLVMVLALTALGPAILPGQQAVAQGGATDQPDQGQVEKSGGAQQAEDGELLPVTGNEQAPVAPVLANFQATTPDMRVLLDEMTLVWVHSEEYARIIASCAGVGLRNVAPFTGGPMVLIPNAGDLDVDGSTVAIKLYPNGEVEFIPRTQGQRIRVPVDVGDKVAGQEVLSLSFAEGMELMEDGYLVWTAKHHGPYGNGHGLPGHISTCDPTYPGDDFYAELEDDDNDN